MHVIGQIRYLKLLQAPNDDEGHNLSLTIAVVSGDIGQSIYQHVEAVRG